MREKKREQNKGREIKLKIGKRVKQRQNRDRCLYK